MMNESYSRQTEISNFIVLNVFTPTPKPFSDTNPIKLLRYFAELRHGFDELGVPEAASVRSLHFLLRGKLKLFTNDSMFEKRCRKHHAASLSGRMSILDRYLADSELQKAIDKVTLISQKLMEDEKAYADVIIAASDDCFKLSEDHTLVHYYVRGLLETICDVGVDLGRTPVHLETVPIPKLTEERTRQAFSVVTSDYCQLNCWTCRDCIYSIFTCPTLTPSQGIYFAYLFYLDHFKRNPTTAQFFQQKTDKRVQLAQEHTKYKGKHPVDEQRTETTNDYAIHSNNRPRTLMSISDDLYPLNYDINPLGGSSNCGGLYGGLGRATSVHFGDKFGLYETEALEGEHTEK